MIILAGFCLSICLIWILNDIREFLLDRWRPQRRAAHNPNGPQRDTFFGGPQAGALPLFLIILGIGLGLVWLVWTVPVFLIILGIGIALAPALRHRWTRTALTEQEWQECKRPGVMLDFAWRRSRAWKRHLLSWFGHPRFRLSSNKLRRVSEAACRALASRRELRLPLDTDGPGIIRPIPAERACKDCCGSGARPGTAAVPCSHCKGRRVIQEATLPFFGVHTPRGIEMARPKVAPFACPTCYGQGVFIPDPCPSCRGSGSGETRLSPPAWVKDDDPGLDPWGGVGDKLFGVSLTGEQGGQMLIAVMAQEEALQDWPAEHVALWRLALWTKCMADELETGAIPILAQPFVKGSMEADEKLVGEEACRLLREILGDPFHPVDLAPAWRDPAIQELAAAAYGDPRQPIDVLDSHRLAALARAVDGAEGDTAAVLSHLKEPGPHVRGCWVVDLLLLSPA
jgi:hypothetical protein